MVWWDRIILVTYLLFGYESVCSRQIYVGMKANSINCIYDHEKRRSSS